MSEEERSDIKVLLGATKFKLTLQISILSVVLFLAGYVVLWADRHNDNRYVQQAVYANDRVTDTALATEKQKDLDRRLDDHQKWMENISQKLDQLLQQRAYGPPQASNHQVPTQDN